MYFILNFLTMILESPYTFKFFTFNSITFFSPWTNASYSAVLLVHSNSNIHERKCLFFFGSIRTQPAPDPSKFLDPSIKSVQKLSSSIVLESITTSETNYTILQSNSSTRENERISGCVSSVPLDFSAW